MSQSVPFRIHLREPAPGDTGDASALLKYLRVALEPGYKECDTLLEAAQFPSDAVAMALISRYDEIQGDGGYGKRFTKKFARLLVQGALSRARAENLIWTPIIDELVSRGIWDSAHREWQLGQEGEEIPHSEKLSDELIPWISRQEDPEGLFPLLEFLSTTIASKVALYTPTPDKRLIDAVASKTPGAFPDLALNRHLTAEDRAYLASCAWEHVLLKTEAGRMGPEPESGQVLDRVGAIQCFNNLATHSEGMSVETKEELLATVEHHQRVGLAEDRVYVWALDPFLTALLQTPSLTDEEFVRISRLVSTEGASKVLVDPRCTP